MALDITTQDIVIDESANLQDDDIDPLLAPHSTNTTLQYMLGLDGSGGLSSPEVAYQSNFVVASASAGETITSVVLTQNSSGTPFSTPSASTATSARSTAIMSGCSRAQRMQTS